MSIFKGLSKEFQVGTLTTIAITILILGYNFMRGKDNPFTRGKEFIVYYDSTQGLGVGTSVIYNGLRIGQLSSIDITDDGLRMEARFEVASSLEIPKDSKFQIQSELLGGQKVRLILGGSKRFAEDGDTLIGTYASDQFSAINEQILPIASKVDSLLTQMNRVLHHPGLDKALVELPGAMSELKLLLRDSRGMVATNADYIEMSMKNVALFTENLKEYNKSIRATLSRIDKSTMGLDTIKIARILQHSDSLVQGLNQLTQQINSGNGSASKFIYDDGLYENLSITTYELNKVLMDLKRYPEKYVPVPFTKRQRKQAKEESLKDTAVWN
jgi:phospholipid/cholesterol/gamma-HCH transport system substrate-binding protein